MLSQKKYFPWLLSLLSGILLTAGWPAYGFPILLFIAFIPLLFLADLFVGEQERYKRNKVFGFAYIAFLVWNLGATWWVINASLVGAIAAFVFNTLFMALVFWMFFLTKRKLGDKAGYLSLIAYWCAFEYLHLQWELSWPWLTLGNGFASAWKWVQWYEYTGVFGGSLWILMANIIGYQVLKSLQLGNRKKAIQNLSFFLGILVIPIIISYYLFNGYREKTNQVDVVVVQPNIDPYNEKFNGLSSSDQLNKLLRLGSSLLDSNTDYLVAPETAMAEDHWENQLLDAPDIGTVKLYLKAFPKLKFVGGITSSKLFAAGEKLSESARKFTDSEGYYDSYNTAMQMDSSKVIQLYHKSKLVPGVEQMPYPGIFKFVEKFAINLGGASGSLGKQEERTVFKSKEHKVAPVICYESIYGEYVGNYIKNGADLIFIITNDGWWGDTPGYKQHLNYARLRAIETRRSIARSANTGISCFIDQKGEMNQPTEWWTDTAIRGKINANNEMTFYTRFGDYIAKFFVVITFGLLIMLFIRKLKA